MSFVDLFSAMKSAYCAYGCDVPIFIGKQFLQQHTVTTRVVLYQDQDLFANPSVSVPVATQGYNAQGINPRPIKTRRCGIVANIWATAPEQGELERQYRADLALLDVLINQTILVLQQTVSGIYELASGGAADGNDQAMRAGLGYNLVFFVDTPIIDMPWSVAIDACRKTWAQGPATAQVTVSGAVDNSTTPPTFQPGVTFTTPP